MALDLTKHLSTAGISPTRQRLAIASILFTHHQHLTADQVHEKTIAAGFQVSRATVYNTLKLFVEKQLLREIFVNQAHAFYDSNTQPHFHIYHVDDDHLQDMPIFPIEAPLLQKLPAGTVYEGMDLIVRVRRQH